MDIARKNAVVNADPDNEGEVGASIPGIVSKVLVEEGDTVKKNDVLAVIEAMKMETNILARKDGKVANVRVAFGQDVKAGELLFVIE